MAYAKIEPSGCGEQDPKCPKCGLPMHFWEDEDTGHQWWVCENAECDNLNIYEPDEVRV